MGVFFSMIKSIDICDDFFLFFSFWHADIRKFIQLIKLYRLILKYLMRVASRYLGIAFLDFEKIEKIKKVNSLWSSLLKQKTKMQEKDFI